MPKLNLFLSADVEVEPSNIIFNQSLLAPEPTLRTKAQRKAFHCILSNVGKYKSQPILFNMRNQANAPEQYNPHGYGHKPLIAVIRQLQRNGLLTLKKGVARLVKKHDGDFEEAQLSEFRASEALVKLCEAHGYTAKATAANPQQFVELRDMNGRLVPFEETSYSRHINELMADYCQFLNAQRLKVDGEDLGHLHLVRKYKDWDGSKRLIHGGRSYHPFMSYPKAKRESITINGSPVSRVDYPASLLNVLYSHVTGRFLYPEDPYNVEGITRTTAKFLANLMLNNGSIQSASLAANKNISSEQKLVRDHYNSDLRRHRTVRAMMRLIANRNAPIAECFFKGKAMGQKYAWLEANLVFEVARLLARMEVPALTVHDEFIVPVEMVGAVQEVMYTTAFQDVWLPYVI